jgi:hypothetical protein
VYHCRAILGLCLENTFAVDAPAIHLILQIDHRRTIEVPGQPVAPRRNSMAGNGIFRCRDRRPKSTGETAIVLQRPATSKTGGKIPAEKGLFSIVHGLEVREDWVVETEGTKLPTPLAVVEPVSDT